MCICAKHTDHYARTLFHLCLRGLHLLSLFRWLWRVLRMYFHSTLIAYRCIRCIAHEIINQLLRRYLLYLAYYRPGMAADQIPSPPNYAVKLVAVASIWAVAVLNMVSRSSGNYLQNVTTVAKFIGLILICILGIVWLAKGTYNFHFQNAFEGSSTEFWPYGTGIYLALFSVRKICLQ